MKNCRPDAYGFRCYVTVHGHEREKHFPKGTPVDKRQRWIDEAKVALRALPRPASGQAGTVGALVKTYLENVKPTLDAATYRSRVCELAHYLIAFRHDRLPDLTRERLIALRTAWMTTGRAKRHGVAGCSVKTVINRETSLRHFFHHVLGSKAPTPLDDLPPLQKPPADPKFVSVKLIKRVAANLADDPLTQAWFMVLTSTGQRPAQLRRTHRHDVDIRRRIWLVRRAKGGNPIPVVLTDDMVIAWKAFIGAGGFDAVGAVRQIDGSDYAKRIYAAGWPQSIRPYNAKHSVAIALGEAGAEWEDLRDWFGHTDLKTTRIYTGLITSRLRGTSKLLAGRIGWSTDSTRRLPAARVSHSRTQAKTGANTRTRKQA